MKNTKIFVGIKININYNKISMHNALLMIDIKDR